MATTTPEEKTLNFQIAEAEKNMATIRKFLRAKTKELDLKIVQDNADIFGERKSEPQGTIFLFSERVEISQRDKVLIPIKVSLTQVENELKKLILTKENLFNIGVTGNLF
jgi:hypothetical protein